jgi:thioredoxin
LSPWILSEYLLGYQCCIPREADAVAHSGRGETQVTVVNVKLEDFEDLVASNDIVLVDFWASWCGPCRMFAPIFERAAEAHPEAVFAKVDTEAEVDLARAFNIMSIPTLMVFREQVIVYAQPGALPAASLEDLLTQVNALDMAEVHSKMGEQAARA